MFELFQLTERILALFYLRLYSQQITKGQTNIILAVTMQMAMPLCFSKVKCTKMQPQSRCSVYVSFDATILLLQNFYFD